MYAIIESCGKQYKVEEGEVVFFEKLNAKEGDKVTFDKVMLISDDGKVQIGNPYVKNAKVEGEVVKHGKAKKIIVFKMKAKANYRRRYGHRQPYTQVKITSIGGNSSKTTKTDKKSAKTTAKKETAKAESKTTTKATSTKKATKTEAK